MAVALPRPANHDSHGAGAVGLTGAEAVAFGLLAAPPTTAAASRRRFLKERVHVQPLCPGTLTAPDTFTLVSLPASPPLTWYISTVIKELEYNT